MATVGVANGKTEIQLTPRDFKGLVDPDWCPGCGDFGVLNALQRACSELGLQPHEILTVSGIGCSSNLPGYFNSYGMHTLHGRSLAVATGAKLANHDLTVFVTGGDGDGYGIGGNHFTHSARRNIDLSPYQVLSPTPIGERGRLQAFPAGEGRGKGLYGPGLEASSSSSSPTACGAICTAEFLIRSSTSEAMSLCW